ncbi:hypothetical protein SAMN04489761_2210 [Tenacibaculum sp. MAR_2009_124]|uniref:tetratricopeptide repeat protein n=1 Tax=Tenacibaculum sp. MAR_2009_124 TaxID=1250059 RepID=UPI000897F296|nr:hypothetical protein [Tenacibaculum sp. MAR_2009_124]SEB99895.1 hypothetical protein SAMN04489761_2210 [Tenacibaculum sp. MAR_2009_124]
MATLVNNYIFKALDAYPYDLEETVEALNYALSYDDKNSTALLLSGRIQAEILKDYEKAKSIYQEALAENVNAIEIYPHYIHTLLCNEDLEEAKRLIDFALTVKGSDKAVLYVAKANLFEQKKKYKKALAILKKARIQTYNSDYLYCVEKEEERIKGKIPKKKKEKSKKCKKKKKK